MKNFDATCKILIKYKNIVFLPTAPPCTPSPCGPGAICTESGNKAMCSCPSGTSGDAATTGCRPECVVSSECQRDRACVRNKCIDPCVGACGNGAMCRVFDHAPICSCPPRTTGDPFIECRERGIFVTFFRYRINRYSMDIQ